MSPPVPTAPAAIPEVVFQARKLRKVYHTGEVDVVALDGVDLDLNASELVCLLGASGSGKSTLLNILGGLDAPTSGELLYKGWLLDSTEENTLTHFRRNCVGFVFQFYNLIPSLTARENAALITGISRNPMSPEEALEMGLVNTVVPYEELEAETVKRARQILQHSPLAIRLLKSGLNADVDGQTGLQELAGNATLLYYMTEEAQEGRNAFNEKRKPDFRKYPWRP